MISCHVKMYFVSLSLISTLVRLRVICMTVINIAIHVALYMCRPNLPKHVDI